MANHTMVMRGSLREFELLDILQCVGTSRQYTIIELLSQDGRRKASIAMKAGQVLTVEHAGHHGRPAFIELLEKIPDLFVVYRLPDLKTYSKTLGRLVDLLAEAAPAPKPPAVPPKGNVTQPMRLPPVPMAPAESPTVAVAEAPIVVAIASPKGGVGKTTITLNLALSLAERGLRIVVVDADINGDLLSAMNAQGKVDRGAFDILDQLDQLEATLRTTAEPRLRILPACGPTIPMANLVRDDLPEAWRRLMQRLALYSDITLVDCPAGMFHSTRSVLRSASHLVGVFQADMIASRSFPMFLKAYASLPEGERPKLAGVVVNMFQGRAQSSVEAFHDLCTNDEHCLFDTTIPRSDVFGAATLEGMPLRVAGDGPSPVAYLFDMLAEEVCSRVGVARRPRPRPRVFLL